VLWHVDADGEEDAQVEFSDSVDGFYDYDIDLIQVSALGELVVWGNLADEFASTRA